MEIRHWNPLRIQKKTMAISQVEKLAPPCEVQVKLSVEPYRVVLSAKCREQINHPTNKGTACRNYFASMLKITN